MMTLSEYLEQHGKVVEYWATLADGTRMKIDAAAYLDAVGYPYRDLLNIQYALQADRTYLYVGKIAEIENVIREHGGITGAWRPAEPPEPYQPKYPGDVLFEALNPNIEPIDSDFFDRGKWLNEKYFQEYAGEKASQPSNEYDYIEICARPEGLQIAYDVTVEGGYLGSAGGVLLSPAEAVKLAKEILSRYEGA